MARATYEEIAEAVVRKELKFIVVPPFEEDMALTVYPPSTYLTDYGIDVFLKDNTAEFWLDGYKLRKLNSIQDATAVADAIIEELEKIQAVQKAEHES